MTDKKRRLKLNNNGSAIVTVLIVIIFISILATTVLYLAGRNAKMKATDRNTKESFYETERTMEEIKAGLVRIVSSSYETAYASVITDYMSYDPSGRKYKFFNDFFDAFVGWFSVTDHDCRLLATDTAAVESVGEIEEKRNEGYVLIKNVVVKDTKNGYTTIIKTGFMIVCPDITFEVGNATSVPDSPSGNDVINLNDCVKYINWEKR